MYIGNGVWWSAKLALCHLQGEGKREMGTREGETEVQETFLETGWRVSQVIHHIGIVSISDLYRFRSGMSVKRNTSTNAIRQLLCCSYSASSVRLVTSYNLAPLLSVDVPSRADSYPSMTAAPLTSEEIWQVVLIHQIFLPLPAVFCSLLLVLLLVLSQDQILAPVVLASALHVVQLAAGGAMYRLWYAVDVAALVVLEVLLEVQPHVSVAVSRAGSPCEGGLPALGAELLVHLPCHVEATVAAENPCLQLLDT